MLRQWVADDKPVWGTCAGMILLSNTALVQKEGGQVSFQHQINTCISTVKLHVVHTRRKQS
jgi:glutamine amidotransferase PdxT